jgi:hypothetical protein
LCCVWNENLHFTYFIHVCQFLLTEKSAWFNDFKFNITNINKDAKYGLEKYFGGQNLAIQSEVGVHPI